MPTLPDEEIISTPCPLPRSLEFSVGISEKSLFYIITFEEFELLEAFEKLGKNGEKFHIEFDARAPRHLMQIRVYSEMESIELKRFRVKE